MRRRIANAISILSTVFAAGSLGSPFSIGPIAARADPATVLVVGDSLAVGMKPYLVDMLVDREVTFDSRAGWTTPQGMRALRGALRQLTPQTVIFNLGTNDGSNVRVFADRVRRTLRTVPRDTCVVWTAISRARRKGAFTGLNRVLRTAAHRDARVAVIPWDRMVRKGTVLLPDGIHPDQPGFAFRSYVTAAAVQRGCGDGVRRL